MRGGGRLFLLLGVVIAAVAALLLLFFLQPPPATTDIPVTPTPVPQRQVVVARIDIPANTVLTDTETFLTIDDMPEPDFNAQPGQFFTSFADLQNMLTVRPILANEPIRKVDVTEGGLSLLLPTAEPDQPRPKAIPFQVGNLTGVADLIKPGDFVDLIVTFELEKVYVRPRLESDPNNPGGFRITFVDATFVDATTKTLIQNVQVMRLLRQRVEEEGGTPTPEAAAAPATGPESPQAATGGAPAGSGDTFVPGNWLLILAVTDQEAEIIRYSLQRSVGMALVLRGRDDTAVEDTTGVTLSILVSQFGLPEPQPFAEPTLSPDDFQVP